MQRFTHRAASNSVARASAGCLRSSAAGPSSSARQAPARLSRVAATSLQATRPFSSSLSRGQATPVDDDAAAAAAAENEEIERVQDEVDVCIVGGGPAGLSAAIRIKQQANEAGKDIRVILLEKGPEVGECERHGVGFTSTATEHW